MAAWVRVTYYVLANKKYYTQCLTTTTRPYEICNYTFSVVEEDLKSTAATATTTAPSKNTKQNTKKNKTIPKKKKRAAKKSL